MDCDLPLSRFGGNGMHRLVCNQNRKESRKRHFERINLARFRQSYAGFPEGRTQAGQHPIDFIISQPGRCLGIEVTRLFKDSASVREERLESKIVWEAQSEFLTNGGPALRVDVYFRKKSTFKKAKVRNAAIELAAFVQNAIRADCVPFDVGQGGVPESRPSWLEHLRVRTYPLPNGFWSAYHPGCVKTMTIDFIQQELEKNGTEKKLVAYRQRCQEAWLLMIREHD